MKVVARVQSLTRRQRYLAALLLSVILMLYVGARFVVVPQLARMWLNDVGATDPALGIDVEHLRYAPFAGAIELIGLTVTAPDGAFYLWPETPICDQEFARRLYEQQHVTVLPGSFLSREVNGRNPGSHRVRMALVAEPAECIEAAQRIRRFIESL